MGASWGGEVVGVDNDRVEWVPCADQTWVGADIDLMVTSCLKGVNKFPLYKIILKGMQGKEEMFR